MKIFVALLTTFYLLLSTHAAHAQEEFSTSVVATYDVSENGSTLVSHEITLTNNLSTVHATSYVFSSGGQEIQNISVLQQGKVLPFLTNNQENGTVIKIDFPDAVVGRGNSRTFIVSYNDKGIATRNGNVWEIAIPRLSEPGEYSSYTLLLLVPSQFGEPAYLSPRPQKKDKGAKIIYSYSASQLATTGVIAGFGNFQVFGFELLYHLQNPLGTKAETEIALPPDSAFQKIYYTSISPSPLDIQIDEDGNWLAKYVLSPREQLDIKAVGTVQLFASPQEDRVKQPSNLEKYLKESKYWPTQNQRIMETARSLKSPKEIYDFVVNTLTYDYSRVREGVERKGAAGALESPKNAICMEFTDLFIALTRASGIPAREVNGYAYTENPEIQPLSLVADVLHAWPEYWDFSRGIWVPVDPTWGNTTGGVDFFSELDLSHFAFVFHGTSDQEPYPAGSYKLAGNPQKDVSVFFGTLPDTKPNLAMSINLSKPFLPFISMRGTLKVKNDGTRAMYNVSPEFRAEGGGEIKPTDEQISFLPPFTTREIQFSWSNPQIFPNKNKIVAQVGNSRVEYILGTEFLIWQIFGLFLLLTIVTGAVISLVLARKKIIHAARKITRQSWNLPFSRRKG